MTSIVFVPTAHALSLSASPCNPVFHGTSGAPAAGAVVGAAVEDAAATPSAPSTEIATTRERISQSTLRARAGSVRGRVLRVGVR